VNHVPAGSATRACVCIIDPEGDYRSLEALPGVITLGGDAPAQHGVAS
jgi:hypothetical protein